MKIKRTHIAAGGTVAALGVLAAVALGAGSAQQPEPATAQKAPPLEVRTQVVHRTIRVVRHQKPRQPVAAAGPPATATATQDVGPGSTAATDPGAVKPLRTKTSGSSYDHEEDDGSDDHERDEYEDDHHGDEDDRDD